MLIDSHCHILPYMDDGAESLDISLQMIRLMHSQGVQTIVATPHFYAHREKSVKSFLERRAKSYKRLVEADKKNTEIMLGAEVAVEHSISQLSDVDKLCIEGTDYILFELPFTAFSHWALEEINNISYEYKLVPVFAHINRYLNYYSKSEMTEVLQSDAIMQFNIEAFASFKERRFVKELIKKGHRYMFGSDAHNMTDRKPNWDLLLKKTNAETIDSIEAIL